MGERTRKAFAKILGITPASLCDLENGPQDGRVPSLFSIEVPGTGQNHLYLPSAVTKPKILVSRAFPPPAGWKNLSKNRYLRVLLFVAKCVNSVRIDILIQYIPIMPAEVYFSRCRNCDGI